jgi:hypothetical protein
MVHVCRLVLVNTSARYIVPAVPSSSPSETVRSATVHCFGAAGGSGVVVAVSEVATGVDGVVMGAEEVGGGDGEVVVGPAGLLATFSPHPATSAANVAPHPASTLVIRDMSDRLHIAQPQPFRSDCLVFPRLVRDPFLALGWAPLSRPVDTPAQDFWPHFVGPEAPTSRIDPMWTSGGHCLGRPAF